MRDTLRCVNFGFWPRESRPDESTADRVTPAPAWNGWQTELAAMRRQIEQTAQTARVTLLACGMCAVVITIVIIVVAWDAG